MAALILAGAPARAQDGDPISSSGEYGSGGGDSGSGSGGAYYGLCNDPDEEGPCMFSSRPMFNAVVQCMKDVPAPPERVWAGDGCDRERPVVTNLPNPTGNCSNTIVRTWTSCDTSSNTSTLRETITVNDTVSPSINYPAEIALEAEACGTAVVPDFVQARRVTDNCCLKSVTQSPGPGSATHKVGDVFPVTLVAADECNVTSKTFMVKVVCPGCKSCPSGKGAPQNDSIRLDLNLGRLADGRSAGYLSLYTQHPNRAIFTPEILSCDKDGQGAATLRDTNGFLRQIRSADTLVDVVADNGYFCSYDINFYSPANWGVPDEHGLYAPVGAPFLSWQIYAPATLSFNGRVIGDPRRVVLRKRQGGTIVRYDYAYDQEREGWTLTSGRVLDGHNNSWDNGLKVESRSSTWNDDHTIRTEIHVVGRPDGQIAQCEENDYRVFPWGEACIKTTLGTGTCAQVTERAYYEDPQQPGRNARLAWERQPDGNFAWWNYDGNGRVVMTARAWKDAAVPTLESNALMSAAAVTLNDYAPVDPADDGSTWPWEPRIVMEMAAGTVVSKTCYSYVAGGGGDVIKIQEQCASSGAAYGAAGNLRTRTVYYSNAQAFWSGQIKSVEYPDGRMDRYVLERGLWITNAGVASFSPAPAGDHLRTTLIHGTTLHPDGTGKTTREVSVRPIAGEDVLRETYVFDGQNYVRVDWTRREFDGRGHLLAERYANGLARSNVWSDCCGKESDTDVDNVQTEYEYDPLGRLVVQTKLGVPKISANPGYAYQAPLVATYERDAAGNLLREYRNNYFFGESSYDAAGNLATSRDAANLVTQHVIEEGGRKATTIRPGGATEIVENYLDGRPKSETGTGVVPRFYDYGVNPDGSQWTMIHTGGPDSPMWEKTTTDMFGRESRTEKPGFGGVTLVTTRAYKDNGQLAVVRQWTGTEAIAPIGVATLYEYDELGEQIRAVQDVNGNGKIDLVGSDRVQETQTRIVSISGTRWRETSSKIYPKQESSSSVVLSIQRQQMAGAGSGSYVASQTVDGRGNTNTTTYAINPVQKIVTTTQNPSDSTVDAITVHRNGLLHSTRPALWRDPTYFAYDDIGRTVKVTEPRIGRQTTEYNGFNQIAKTRDAKDQMTSFAYDPDTGLQTCVIDALSNEVHTAYDLQGRPTNVWGATYPVAYEYDAYGRMAAMKTWRDVNGASDVTRWCYDEATGLLTNKVYADGSGPSYEYDAAGRLTKRTWARGVTTEYAYDALGQLTNVDYSDDTPDMSYTYDRLGRQVTVRDVLGMRSNVYDAATLDLVAEQLPDGHMLARSYDRFGRPTGIALGADYHVAYAYDDAGRFAAINSAVNAVTTAVKYIYLDQSDLLAGWTVGAAPGVSNLIVRRSYEPRRDLVATVQVANATGTLARFVYVNDPLGRRVSRKDARADGTTVSNVFGYDVRSELEAAVMGTNQFGYQYDAIGNRQAAIANDQSVQYEANALNQYPSILPAAGTPTYDADGNMTSDGTFIYSWDAENRLAEIRPAVTNTGSKLMQCLYDYQGRRVGKRIFTWGTFRDIDDWYWTESRYFTYDGWNPINERKPARPTTMVPYIPATSTFLLGLGGQTAASSVWGLDLSGSIQGAGGVGGLLCHVRGGRPLFSFCDANGNVTGMVDTNGVAVAQYDYDPFGNLLAQSGDQADANPFRFSSKPWDEETGLYYYGFRFYSPGLGRWINRDPIEEAGGCNLFGFVGNNPINLIDPIGLDYIAVGIRPAKAALGMQDHMSIEFYEEKPQCTKKDYKFKSSDVGKAPLQNAKRTDQFELIPTFSDYEHRYSKTVLGKPVNWSVPARVSFINRTSSANDLVVIFDDSAGDAATKWKQVVAAALGYKYAEQLPIGNPLKNWPNSKYQLPPGNNSNTFIHEMAGAIGASAAVFSSTPGATRAAPVTDNGPVPVYKTTP